MKNSKNKIHKFIAIMVSASISNVAFATDEPKLENRKSFRLLEDERINERKKTNKSIEYRKNNDDEYRPIGLMNDIKRPGQSSQMSQSVSFEDAKSMSEDALRNKKTIVINLEDTYQIGGNNDVLDALERIFAVVPDATLLVDCADAKEIKNSALSFTPENKQTFLKKVSFKGNYVTKIQHGLLSNCSSLTHADFSELSDVEQIGHGFLANCSSLTHVDLSGFRNVKKIGISFLMDCTSIRNIDLSGLSKVEEIADAFLLGCTGLSKLDLSPLTELRKIGQSFLAECGNLTSVDLRSTSNLQKIGDGFLLNCPNLQYIVVSKNWPLKKDIKTGFRNALKFVSIIELSLDPRRPGVDFELDDLRAASIMLRNIAKDSPDWLSNSASLDLLEQVFSSKRAAAILKNFKENKDESQTLLVLPSSYD